MQGPCSFLCVITHDVYKARQRFLRALPGISSVKHVMQSSPNGSFMQYIQLSATQSQSLGTVQPALTRTVPAAVCFCNVWYTEEAQTPGTAKEHKRQETPTINPNHRQPAQLTDQAPGSIERAAQESTRIKLLPCVCAQRRARPGSETLLVTEATPCMHSHVWDSNRVPLV